MAFIHCARSGYSKGERLGTPKKFPIMPSSPLNSLTARTLVMAAFLGAIAPPAGGQIVPDATLGSESTAVIEGQSVGGTPSALISGGAVRGNNLFHSLREFNVRAGRAVFFANPPAIGNIITRVTGINSSQILGVLGVLGETNLFLLNPNGILFGPQAALALNGSFLASTASSLLLADGSAYSAIDPAAPALAIAGPVGLDFSGSPGTIVVQGAGHDFITPGNPLLPSFPRSGTVPLGLAVAPGRSLALVGGDVTFTGGVATALAGQLAVGSVRSGRVAIEADGGLALNYRGVGQFQDVYLSELALLNASGGSIQVAGRNVTLDDAALVWVNNFGFDREVPNAIEIQAAGSLTVSGLTEKVPVFPDLTTFNGGISSQTAAGRGADIFISTPRLTLKNSGGIVAGTFGAGRHPTGPGREPHGRQCL